jgi:hypothetical protein
VLNAPLHQQLYGAATVVEADVFDGKTIALTEFRSGCAVERTLTKESFDLSCVRTALGVSMILAHFFLDRYIAKCDNGGCAFEPLFLRGQREGCE